MLTICVYIRVCVCACVCACVCVCVRVRLGKENFETQRKECGNWHVKLYLAQLGSLVYRPSKVCSLDLRTTLGPARHGANTNIHEKPRCCFFTVVVVVVMVVVVLLMMACMRHWILN